jgi:hypothetical protein
MKHLLALVAILAVAGCDGHGRSLHLVPPGVDRPGWTVSSVVIPVEGGEDVPAIVSGVARDRELTLDPDDGSYRRDLGGGSLTMRLKREDAGYWTVALLDWPRFTRSPQSVQAKRAIRAALRTSRDGTPALPLRQIQPPLPLSTLPLTDDRSAQPQPSDCVGRSTYSAKSCRTVISKLSPPSPKPADIRSHIAAYQLCAFSTCASFHWAYVRPSASFHVTRPLRFAAATTAAAALGLENSTSDANANRSSFLGVSLPCATNPSRSVT